MWLHISRISAKRHIFSGERERYWLGLTGFERRKRGNRACTYMAGMFAKSG